MRTKMSLKYKVNIDDINNRINSKTTIDGALMSVYDRMVQAETTYYKSRTPIYKKLREIADIYCKIVYGHDEYFQLIFMTRIT